jgi:crotonobetainyl-CoA:carnitine CoA-transferase CaiB-like acyl-CoA transferase
MAARDAVAAAGPLTGTVVLDLSRVLAGPFCTMLLGDLGARVVKVEHPLEGDVTRGWGPPYDDATGMSSYFLAVNRNKESIALNLRESSGVESVRRLAGKADVVVESFPPGGLEGFGLSLARLREENPRLVTASITGFGRSGEEAGSPGFDLLAQAGAGLMAITGDPQGEPTKVGVAVSDLFAGCFLAIGIAGALAGRARSGRGSHVETDLFSSTLAALVNVAESVLCSGEEARRHGNAHAQIVPYRVFAASDGALVVAVGTDRQFARLAELLGRPEWARGAWATNEGRVRARAALEATLEPIFRREARDAWIARLRGAGIPAGAVRGPLEALRCAAARALGAVVSSGGLEFVASPIRVADWTAPVGMPPRLDEHGDALRHEFGLPERATP